MKKYLVLIFLFSCLSAVAQEITTDSLRRSLLIVNLLFTYILNNRLYVWMKKVLTVISFFFVCFALPAQNLSEHELDSLFSLYSPEKKDTQQVWILSQLSRTYIFKSPDSGFLFADRQSDLSRFLEYKDGELDAKTNIALYWWSVGEYSVAAKLFTENIEYYRSKNDVGGMGGQYGLMFNVYRDQGDFKQAFECMRKSDSIGRVLNYCKDCTDSASVGSVYYEMKQYDSALLFLKVIENSNSSWGWGNLMLGKAYVRSGNDEKALKYYRVSVRRLIEENNMKDLISAFNSLADLYKNSNIKDSALFYANKALEIARQNKFNKETLQSYLILAVIYDKINTRLALDYYRLAFDIKDSIYSQEKQRQISGYKFTEELNLQQSEAAKNQYKNKLKTTVLIAVLGLFVIISILLYRNNRHKQAAKKKVESAYERLKATQQQLVHSEKMASLGELTAGIAHEIQNPLNFVNNFSEVNDELIKELKAEVEKGNLDQVKAIAGDIGSNSEKINHHGKRADAIVKGMLQHSRVSTGQKELTDINALCDEYMRLAYHGLRAKEKSFNAKFETKFDDHVGKINIIPQDIGRVILNLVNNAFYAVSEKKKHVPDGYEPTVTLITTRENGRIEIEVKDNGNGIPNSIVDKIFQPFFTTKPTGQGTGLGLSLAYDIVKAHGGEIKVETKEGEGTTFIVSLNY